MYDLVMLKRNFPFPLFCCTEPPVCCDAIYRLGCLVASFCVDSECWVCDFVSAFELNSADEQTFSCGDFGYGPSLMVVS